MATVLFGWELGSGWGHLTSLGPLATGLAARGHRVFVAAPDLGRARQLFADRDVRLLPAPHVGRRFSNSISPACTFAQVLHNTVSGDPHTLGGLVAAWKTIFDLTRPDLVVLDHAPSALVAARGATLRTVVIGTGFSAPAPVIWFPDWRPHLGTPKERLVRDERHVLATINACLERNGQPQLDYLGQLYGEVDRSILMTWKELDPFGPRDTPYTGNWPEMRGAPPQWPSAGGKRVFAYLRPSKDLPAVIEALARRDVSAIVRVTGVAADAEKLRRKNVTIERGFVDLESVAEECDCVMFNATHIMTLTMLAAGKPLVMLPPFMEQNLTTQLVARAGAGVGANLKDLPQIEEALDAVLGDEKYRASAQWFANKYGKVDRQERLEETISTLEKLACEPR